MQQDVQVMLGKGIWSPAEVYRLLLAKTCKYRRTISNILACSSFVKKYQSWNDVLPFKFSQETSAMTVVFHHDWRVPQEHPRFKPWHIATGD